MKVARFGWLLFSFSIVLAGPAMPQEVPERVLDPAYHHLGDDPTPEWTEAPTTPEGTQLVLEFEARAIEGEAALSIGARSVGSQWSIRLNGQGIGELARFDGLRQRFYPVPAGVLRDGVNQLEFLPADPADDITVGNIVLHEGSLRRVLNLVPLHVRVVDEATGEGIPARVTITDEGGELVEVWYAQSATTAVRKGVVYAPVAGAGMEVPAGTLVVWASRGPEWSRARERIELADETSLELGLRHEVDTGGWIACDTHLHTLTFSGHGDSSIEERMVTLAGEGVELAIATDHNHNTDYRPWQREQGLESWFTPVVGNEVTTKVGHFNAFPLDPKDEVPAYDGTDYVKIVEGIRAKGAKAVILNHPRWPDHERGPFGVAGLNPYTGARELPLPIVFDATELINSCTVENDPMQLFRDWFALLNRGERVAAVGSSDSHTVGEPVGQGRTYVLSETDEAAAIDVDQASLNIAQGRSSISMGIFLEVQVDTGGAGDLVSIVEPEFFVGLRIAAPSWVQPESVSIFVNGIEKAASPLEEVAPETEDPAFETHFMTSIPWTHPHDAWVVCVVTGPEAGEPFWPMTNDYTLAATNPVFLDVDGDGTWTPPRESARRLLALGEPSQSDLETALRACDEAVGVHVLDLARIARTEAMRLELLESARSAGASPWLQEWLESLPPVR